MRALLIVGEAPTADTVGRPAFSNRSGDRLASLLGLAGAGELTREHDTVNLRSRADGAWDRRAAADAAQAILAVAPHDRVVLCGRRVADAFGVPFDPVATCRLPGHRVGLVIPHPSGRCRHWNDPATAQIASDALRRLAAADLLAAV